ncbi:hypothetical protein IAU60_005991 [Kwoniella sp. DSM 27419]
MADSLDELRAVRLEPEQPSSDESSGDDSEAPESEPTDEEGKEVDYEVDAIKWAKYRDSNFDRAEGGFKGWHYGVLWKGYLKTRSETEEGLDSFLDDTGNAPMVKEFWNAVSQEQPSKRLKPGKKEPKGYLGEVIETPKPLLKKWFKTITGKNKRDPDTYWRRRQKELERERRFAKGLPTDDFMVTKHDSDYYWNKKRRKERKKRKLEEVRQRASEIAHGVSAPKGPTASAPKLAPGEKCSTPGVPPSTAQTKPSSVPESGPRATPASPVDSLGSLFNSDHEHVDGDLWAGDEEEEQVEAMAGLKSKSAGTKRKLSASDPRDPQTAAIGPLAKKTKVIDKAKAKAEPVQAKPQVAETPLAKTLRLMKMAKIHQSPTSSTSAFGQLQPGIFDAPGRIPPAVTLASPPGTAGVPSANPLPPVPTSIATERSATLAPPTPVTSTGAASFMTSALESNRNGSNTDSIGANQETRLGSDNPVVGYDATSASTDSAIQAGPPGTPAVPMAPHQNNLPTLSVASNPDLSSSHQASVSARAVDTWKTHAGQTPGIANQPRISSGSAQVSPPLTAGPVPHFKPAPPKPATTIERPSNPVLDNRPKYVQPKKVQILDTSIDPLSQRKMSRLGMKDEHIMQLPTSNAAPLPARPKPNVYMPRGQPPTEPRSDRIQPLASYPHRAPLADQSAAFKEPARESLQNASDGRSLRSDLDSPVPTNTPTLPQIRRDKDPRRRPQQTVSTASTAEASASLPTPPPTSTGQIQVAPPTMPAAPSSGGLITFSPSLLLRNPSKFAPVMQTVLAHPTWSAYITPGALDLVNGSWNNRALCPDPTQAYSVLVQYLTLDDNVRTLSGAGITSGGGLCASCCPPSPYNVDAFLAWKHWLHRVTSTTDYSELIELCQAYARKIQPNTDTSSTEQMQLADLRALQARKDVVHYTQYVYITEGPKPAENDGIDILTPDEIIALLHRS